MVGLYGLVSYAVSRRTRELGIRIAVGASYNRVMGIVLRQGMAPACAGLIVGLGLSVITARLLPTLIPINEGYSATVVLWLVPVLLSVTLFAAVRPRPPSSARGSHGRIAMRLRPVGDRLNAGRSLR